MTNVLMSLKFLTTWHTFYVLMHDMFFTLWRTFLSWWRIFVIISGTKYNVNVISILWQFFWCYDMLWCHEFLLMSWRAFDFMTNGLTSWRFYLFYDKLFTPWRIYIWLYDFVASWLTIWLGFCLPNIIFHYFGNKI